VFIPQQALNSAILLSHLIAPNSRPTTLLGRYYPILQARKWRLGKVKQFTEGCGTGNWWKELDKQVQSQFIAAKITLYLRGEKEKKLKQIKKPKGITLYTSNGLLPEHHTPKTKACFN
jgi:hypothetical protein